ncbi:ATP-binding protein [Pseudorhodoferax sp. LjRoot39]|uniref:ATP-binding protein n=1 Tax=Pseudorhodoferax sp. LjRoot39 TaxID=3342328 RepID=UPI003ECFAEDA
MSAPPTDLPPLFPFAAIAGQPALRQALLLAAVDPRIGGVLVEGPRGTAKSTAARALAELIPAAPFVTLPLGASLEHVAGTLDLQQALAGHAVRFAPGLLARADGGVLYVDEINLLPDALVDVLLDAAASGVNVVERDGISHRHAARFVLVGTMNPEEGALRPQLLDRLGLCVRLANVADLDQRQAIVRARLQFEADPAAFRARHAAQQAALADRLAAARARVQAPEALPWSDAVLQAAGALCVQAQVDGLRADLVLLRAARAWAAWQGEAEVTPAHVQAVAELALVHRRKPGVPPPAAAPAPAPQAERPQSNGRDGAAWGPSADAADWGAMPPEPVGTVHLSVPELLPTGREAAAKKA